MAGIKQQRIVVRYLRALDQVALETELVLVKVRNGVGAVPVVELDEAGLKFHVVAAASERNPSELLQRRLLVGKPGARPVGA